MRNNEKQNAPSRARAMNRALLILMAACLAYLARGAYMPVVSGLLSKFSIPPADSITSITVTDHDHSELRSAIARPRYIRLIRSQLNEASATLTVLNSSDFREIYTVLIATSPSDPNEGCNLVIYEKANKTFYAAQPPSKALHSLSADSLDVIRSAIDGDRREFLPTILEALAVECSYADAESLKAAYVGKPALFTALFDTHGAYVARSSEEAEWLMTMDFATDPAEFGKQSKPYFILRGISGQYYLADDEIMLAIDNEAYSGALRYLNSLEPEEGYPLAGLEDLNAIDAICEDGDGIKAVSIRGSTELHAISAILGQVKLPAYMPASVTSGIVMNLSVELKGTESKPLENVGLFNYTITRSNTGEYFIGSIQSTSYPCFRIEEKDVQEILGFADGEA